MEKPEDQYRKIRKERKMRVYRIIDMRTVAEPGYARRWIRRNWARALYAAGWAALGILIRESVAATRPEHWHMGSEIVPAVICWAMAIRCALAEQSAHRRTREVAAGRDNQRRGTTFTGCRFRADARKPERGVL